MAAELQDLDGLFTIERAPEPPTGLQLAVDALAPRAALHATLIVYVAVHRGAVAACRCGHPGLHASPEQLAQATALAVGTVRRTLRILRRAGLVSARGRGGRLVLHVPRWPSRWTARVLEGIRDGVVTVDLEAGTLTHSPTGKALDYEGVAGDSLERVVGDSFPPERVVGDSLRREGQAGVVERRARASAAVVTTCGGARAPVEAPETRDSGQAEFFSGICSSSVSVTRDRSNYIPDENSPPDLPTRPDGTAPPVPSPPAAGPAKPKRRGRPAFSRATDEHRERIEATWARYQAAFDHPGWSLTDDRYKVIRRAHTHDGRSWDDLDEYWGVIAQVPFFRGDNDRRTPYEEPAVLLRAQHFDKYMELHRRGVSVARGRDPQHDPAMFGTQDPTGASDELW